MDCRENLRAYSPGVNEPRALYSVKYNAQQLLAPRRPGGFENPFASDIAFLDLRFVSSVAVRKIRRQRAGREGQHKPFRTDQFRRVKSPPNLGPRKNSGTNPKVVALN